MKKLILTSFCMVLVLPVLTGAIERANTSQGYKYAVHQHSESSYQHAWCSAHKGIEEYENNDKTRVDCLTKDNAVEFDLANKWAESIGQALLNLTAPYFLKPKG